ncbi:WYL domain-containing protein [Bacteroides reticulotermitis]|uniref:WYL domain-containing protein n=1 Tax=Bacteroides reticulotermitis TaxID=1133319 RepID=UPI003A8AB6DB
MEQIPSGQIYLAPIIEAMRDSLSLEITYQSFWHDTDHTFEVYPYCVKVFKQRWYVIAYSPGKDHTHIYALDRIKAMTITNSKFVLPSDFDSELFFADCFGVITDENIKTEKVLIKVHINQNRYIRSLPLHHSQKEEKNTVDYSIFSYWIKPTFDFLQALLSHGGYVEVLSPEWLREEIKGVTGDMYNKYINNTKPAL